jgi:chaperonin GroEL
MNSNVIFNKDAHLKLKEAVDLICNAVKVTLGPRGKNVLTINSYGDAHLTKDGITVANNVRHDDPIINGIINVVREASANTAKTAGDGTTTSLVLTQAIFNGGLKAIQEDCNPTLLKEGMNRALDDILKYIDTLNETISINDTEKLKNIATISANNDVVVGQIALDAVLEAKKFGSIKLDDSKTNETYIKCDRGLTFNNGYYSSHFLNSEKTTIEYNNPLIFVSSIELTNKTLVDLMKYARENNKPLIVLAPEFNESIFMSIFRNFKSGAVQVCPIKLPGFAGNRQEWIEDITAYIDGEVYTSNSINPIKYLGDSEKIVISKDKTSIINEGVKTSCSSQMCRLQTRLLDDTEDFEKETINNRVARLFGSVVTIYVGATTELELKEKKDRIEDAVCALQTALKGGISEGGGMTFMRCSMEHYEECTNLNSQITGYNIVMEALLAPFKQLCINSDLNYTDLFTEWSAGVAEECGYNFKTNKWESLKESGVIDPTLVLKNAITNAVGIVSNLLMTECITYHE